MKKYLSFSKKRPSFLWGVKNPFWCRYTFQCNTPMWNSVKLGVILRKMLNNVAVMCKFNSCQIILTDNLLHFRSPLFIRQCSKNIWRQNFRRIWWSSSLSVWIDVGIKSSPSFSNRCPKIGSQSCYYLKSDIFQKGRKVCLYLGHFCWGFFIKRALQK